MDSNQDLFTDVAGTYRRPRVSVEDKLLELWQVSSTALDAPSRYDRLQYVVREYLKVNPTASRKQTYLTIDDLTRGYGNG